MRRPLIDRRDFLAGAGVAFLAGLAPRAARAAASADAFFATAFMDRAGAYGLALLTERGEIVHRAGLPERGHDACLDPATGRIVVFARQPGTFAAVIDRAMRQPPLTIASAPGRHFFGHGAFSPDGTLLYATENDYENAAGMVGIYDVRDSFARIAEFPTHGVGPHEILLLADGRTLAVANGGIETHPDFGRAKLNLATMKPSLVFLDRADGRLLGKHELPPELHQLSIRHMDEDATGAVWFGCQYEGAAADEPQLLGRARPDGEFALVGLPEKVLRGFRNYVGSVAVNRAAGVVAFTSPQGNCLAVLDTATGNVRSVAPLREVCGVAADGKGFLATTGAGEVIFPDGTDEMRDVVFDNHILRLHLR